MLTECVCCLGWGLPGDDQCLSDDGKPVWSPLWKGHCERWPHCCLQRAQAGAQESGDRNSLGAHQLDSFLRGCTKGTKEQGIIFWGVETKGL